MTALRATATAAALAVALACTPRPELDLEELLPDASRLVGWRVVEGPVVHGPDTLYDYLDGGAERYLGYGFRELVHLRYQLGEDPLACVTLDLFDMGGAAGGFGMFRSALPPDASREPWCAEGYSSDTVVAAWQGRLYAHGEADDERPELLATVRELVEQVCEQAPGDKALPAFLEPLPAAGLVTGSERWVAANLLGHAFLPGGVTAGYQLDGRDAQLFFSDLGSEDAADAALARLREHWARQAALDGLPSPGRGGFRYSEAALGSGSAVAAGRFVAGIHSDLPDLPVDAQRSLLAALADRLSAL